MSPDAEGFDTKSSPFSHLTHVQRLSADRSGHTSAARHRLYAGRDQRTNARVLIKTTAKPGIVYQQNLTNEIASLSTINRELPDSRYFPLLVDHGTLRDGRVYLIMTLFDELPLATTIDVERLPAKMVAHLRIAIEVAKALSTLHALRIYHVDLNTMNILYRAERERPVIRIVDFESSYEASRHGAGEFYNPPTTPGYSAPELSDRPPDGRSDLFSLGAVLYTLLAGFEWTMTGSAAACVRDDREIDRELRDVLLRAVAIEPDRRYPSIDGFRNALTGYLNRIWPGRSW